MAYSNLGLYLQTPGDPAVRNQWGGNLNSQVFSLVDIYTSGILTKSVAGSSNVTLTFVNGADCESRKAHYILTGALTGNIIVFWPLGHSFMFSVANNTTGAFTVTLAVNSGGGTPAGATAPIPQGTTSFFYSDGTNVVARGSSSGVQALLNSISSTQGVMLYRNASSWVAIGPGTAGNLLQFNGAGANPSFFDPGTSASIDTGTSGATVALNNGSNTFSGNLTLSGANTLSGSMSITGAPVGTTTAGYRGAPQNIQNTAYTLVLNDSGKMIYHSSATAHTFTIPANASVAFPIGTKIEIVNDNGGGVVTIAITTDTLRWIPAGTTGSRTMAANGSCVISKITATSWQIMGIGLT